MAKKFPELTRDEYKARLDQGQKFKDAGLYEADHAPKGTEFFHVRLVPHSTTFKRKIS